MTTPEYIKEWRAKNPDKVAAMRRRYRESVKGKETEKAYKILWKNRNPEKWAEIDNRAHFKWRNRLKDTPEGRIQLRSAWLKAAYGITYEDMVRMIQEQHGICPPCGKELLIDITRGGKKPVVDHDHDSKKIRGIIHHDCNIGIGKLGDSVESLRRALAYLEHS
jgi:hypothetical protein